MQTNNPPPNFITPQTDSVQSFIDKIPSVSNPGDKWSRDEQPIEPKNFIQDNRSLWEYYNASQLISFEQGRRRGENFSFDSKINENILFTFLKAYIEITKDVCRSSEKNLIEFKYLLDMLSLIHDNVTHVMNKEKIKINNQALLSEMHGMLIGIVHKKIKPNETKRND